jgi:hypothetical protein
LDLKCSFLEKCIGQVGMGVNHGFVVVVIVVVVVVMSNSALHL